MKVQAQRKFAVGAYTPNASTSNNTERKVDHTPNNETQNVYHSKTSAKSLLDIVSFKSMHVHNNLKPVVLLVRLKPEERNDTIANKQTLMSIKKKSACSIRGKKRIIMAKTMCLRSHDMRRSKKINKNIIKQKILKKNLLRKILPVLNKNENAFEQSQPIDLPPTSTPSSKFCLDDEIPLATFRKTTANLEKRKTAANDVGKLGQACSSKHSSVKRRQSTLQAACDKQKRRKTNVKKATRDTQKRSKTNSNEETEGIQKHTTENEAMKDTQNRTTTNIIDETGDTQNRTTTNKNKKTTGTSKKASLIEIDAQKVLGRNKSPEPNQSKEVMTSEKPKEKQEARVTLQKSKQIEEAVTAGCSKEKNLDAARVSLQKSKQFEEAVTAGCSKDKDPGRSNPHLFYGTNEIEKWINNSRQLTTSQDANVSETNDHSSNPPTQDENTIKNTLKSPKSETTRKSPSINLEFSLAEPSTSQQVSDSVYQTCELCGTIDKLNQQSMKQHTCENQGANADSSIQTIDIIPGVTIQNINNEKDDLNRARLQPGMQISSSSAPCISIDRSVLNDYLNSMYDTGGETSANIDELIPKDESDSDVVYVPKIENEHISFPSPTRSHTQNMNADTVEPSVNIDDINTNTRHKNLRRTRSAKAAKPQPGLIPSLDMAKLQDAPVFHPTDAEFTDPIAYFEKILPSAAKYGICKVVAPSGFKPQCVLNESNRFTVTNQYIARLYTRWGPASREMCAIRAYLATQSVHFTKAPLLDGLEINLPKMFHTVQRLRGPKAVFDKKKWNRVAEEMHFFNLISPEKKLDQIYVKYLLPYDTLTAQERQETMAKVEQSWYKKNKKMLERALNPLHRQKRLLGESDSSEEEMEEDTNITMAVAEAEDCIVSGRNMNLTSFKKVANYANKMYLPPDEIISTEFIEALYWKLVLLGIDHVCVNNASVDTGEEGFGFIKSKTVNYGKHPWNLKVLSHNQRNLLRSLGSVLGVTVPTLHFGMIFSTSCWHRDPHGLPWIEYNHQGSEKIWYGIPDEQSANFRNAVEILCPSVCQNKEIWLPSDITMIPPNLLTENHVSLSRVIQKPGEFIIVFPKAYSSSICTGFTISESVYFATSAWFSTIQQDFQEVRKSCEPTTFALEQLLIGIAKDPRSPRSILQSVHSILHTVINEEIKNRSALEGFGLKGRLCKQNTKPSKAWKASHLQQEECDICRTTLYLSKVKGVFGKKSAVCLQHALQVLQKKTLSKKSVNSMELEWVFSIEELENIMCTLQERLLS